MRNNKSTKMSKGLSTRFVLLGAAILVAASSVFASAAVKVTNVTMQKLSQFTELTIICDGPAEFEHQIVKATADRPYRIVVDVKNADHGLPHHNFSALPSRMITRIRTSQFSTDPHVVRIVVDAAGKLTYKVKEGTNSISLHIATPDDDNFTLWSAVPVSQTPELAKATVVDKVSEQPTRPAKMPAYEGNEDNAPRVDYSDPANKDLRPGSKPPEETTEKTQDKPVQAKSDKVDEKQSANKEKAPAKGSQKKEPADVAEPTTIPETPSPDLLSFVYGEASDESESTSDSKSPEKPAEPETKDKPAEPKAEGKPQAKPVGGSNSAGDMTPPKVEKSNLPETRAAKKPALAQGESQGNVQEEAELGAVADAFANAPADDAGDDARSKSERVREKYRSNLTQKESQDDSGEMEGDERSSQPALPKSKIERIREKYKRGIKFAIDEQDERRQQRLADEENDPYANLQGSVGPYNEFLPEREIVVYNSGGRVDPFAPLIEDAVAASEPQRLPDVEALRLVGVLLDDGDDRGLFQDFNGYYYILREGDSVKNGYLLSISEQRATFQIRQYGWNRQVALDLENKF